jgi:hypothetical protein
MPWPRLSEFLSKKTENFSLFSPGGGVVISRGAEVR